MNTTTTTSTRANRFLWISAIILAGVAVFQIGLPERAALAAPSMRDVATNGDYTMQTLHLSNEDLLMLLDSRNETLWVYRLRNRSLFEPVNGGDLKSLFNEGRRIGAGRK
jgi:hypothetical protein